MDTLLRFGRDRQMLVVLDNCEHLRRTFGRVGIGDYLKVDLAPPTG